MLCCSYSHIYFIFLLLEMLASLEWYHCQKSADKYSWVQTFVEPLEIKVIYQHKLTKRDILWVLQMCLHFHNNHSKMVFQAITNSEKWMWYKCDINILLIWARNIIRVQSGLMEYHLISKYTIEYLHEEHLKVNIKAKKYSLSCNWQTWLQTGLSWKRSFSKNYNKQLYIWLL